MNFQSRTTESSNDKLVLLIFLTDCSVSQSVSHGTDGKVGHQSGGGLKIVHMKIWKYKTRFYYDDATL